MNPAFSVVFLTTLIGMGQGLFLALYTQQIYSIIKVLETGGNAEFYTNGSLLALILLICGLLASFFHLGHPERAWRSATKWRTSWLSREVITLPACMFFIFLYGLFQYLEWNSPLFTLGAITVDITLIVGFVATILTFLLFISTGMIYACMRFLQEWHTPLTVLNYILLGSASGFTLATAVAFHYAPQFLSFYTGWAIFLTAMAFLFRMISLIRNQNIRYKSNLKTAIGIRHNKITQKSMGAMGGTFNTREFFHHKSRAFIKSIKWLFILFTFIVPAIILFISLVQHSHQLLVAAVVIQYLGLVMERWYFFAEANHPQNIYYQSIA